MPKWMSVLTLIIVISIIGIVMTDFSTSDTQSGTFTHISMSDLSDLRESDNITILDVRTQEEYDEGHLPDATLIDFYSTDFEEKLSTLDRNKTYLVYCRSGNRSGQTMNMMKEAGFLQVYNLSGGVISLNSSVLCTGSC